MAAKRFAIVGECMLEFSEKYPQQYHLAYAGDTLNVALYCRRCADEELLDIEYITALGEDTYSQNMLDMWRHENIGVSYVRKFAEHLPGLYLINTDSEGERRFHYYRSQSPAKKMFAGSEGDDLCQALLGFDVVYFSGISVAILEKTSQDKLLNLLGEMKSKGIMLCFDNNYRPLLWSSRENAQHILKLIYQQIDIALPSFDDAKLLYGDSEPEVTAERLRHLGVSEVIVKCGKQGYLIATDEGACWGRVTPVQQVVDTTAAGDSFNGGFFAKRLCDTGPVEAAAFGAQLAAEVIQHPGAIIDKKAMSELVWKKKNR